MIVILIILIICTVFSNIMLLFFFREYRLCRLELDLLKQTAEWRIIMQTKDWILLLVPIFCNGRIIFILQKIFENRQITRTIKSEYASLLRQKIDLSLELHAKATRLANEENEENGEIINETIKQYVNSTLDVYYYYVQNKIVFETFESHMEHMATLILELTKCSQQTEMNLVEFCTIVNKIRDELMEMKKECIKLHF